jgi:acyl-CoA thioester hydrolase
VTASDFTVVAELKPRFRDTDAMGHVNNAVYITYLEVARQEYWARLDRHADYRRVPFTLAHVTCDFRSEALVNEVLELGIRLEWAGTKSFAFQYRIWEQTSRRVVVEATTVQVCYDYETKRSIAMPPELRAALESFEGRPLAHRP